MFLLGFAIVLISLGFFTLLLGVNVLYYIDLPPFLVIICPMLGVLAATRSFKAFGEGFKAVVFPKKPVSIESLRQAISTFRLMSKTAAIAVAMSVLICFINIMSHLDPFVAGGASMLGLSMAYLLMSTIYGLLFIFAVFEPVVFVLKKRLMKSQSKEGL